jgi:hypothetical protein
VGSSRLKQNSACEDLACDWKTLSELAQRGLKQPVKREVYYSYGERSYDECKEAVWISMKSDHKECGIATVL